MIRRADRAAGIGVTAVDAEGGDQFRERVPQFPAGMVALAPVPLAQVGKQAREALELGGQFLPHDLQLCLMRHLAEVRLLTGEAGVARAHRHRAA